MSETVLPHSEDRHYRRIPIGYQVKLVSQDHIIAYARAVNLSMGGILLSGPVVLPIGSHCGVAILLADADAGRRVVARGIVVRADGQGMAIAFSKALDQESEETLRRLIHSLAPGAEEPLAPEPGHPVEPILETGARTADAPQDSGCGSRLDKDPASSLAVLMDRLKPGSARHMRETEAWEPPVFGGYEEIRLWLKETVLSATMYERYPDGRWTIQLLLKEQNPGTYRYIVL